MNKKIKKQICSIIKFKENKKASHQHLTKGCMIGFANGIASYKKFILILIKNLIY